MRRKRKRPDTAGDLLKAVKALERRMEIEEHGKPLNLLNIWKSKKAYCRRPKHRKPLQDVE